MRRSARVGTWLGEGVSRSLGGLHVDLGGDHRSSVFLAGSGRSGTTWVSDVVNHDGGYRFVFEPFHPGKVGACAHFRSKQYLRPGDGREEYLEPARRILGGGVRGTWTDRFHRAFVARRRLIKDIRANLLLGWMAANFPGMPIVLLLRHPCAVAASRLALGWKDNLDETMAQGELIEDFLSPMESEIRAARDPFERHVFLWCVDNFVPLKQFAPGGIHLSFYENFLLHPEDETRRLFSFLGKELDHRARRSVGRKLERPSPLSLGGEGAGRTPGVWRRSVDSDRLERAVEMLSLFGLDRIYGRDDMPDPSGARALMGGVAAPK